MLRIKSQQSDPSTVGFHGGSTPDAVDFRIFTQVKRVAHTFTMKSVLAARGDRYFESWLDRMTILCK